jgi:hypothetical protein
MSYTPRHAVRTGTQFRNIFPLFALFRTDTNDFGIPFFGDQKYQQNHKNNGNHDNAHWIPYGIANEIGASSFAVNSNQS